MRLCHHDDLDGVGTQPTLETLLMQVLGFYGQTWVIIQQGVTTHYDGIHLCPEAINPLLVFHVRDARTSTVHRVSLTICGHGNI
jgi:hypothetical protein